jgi:hypothetical protein
LILGMGWLGWTLVFVGLVLVAVAVLALIGLRLWRGVKALGRDLERASSLVSSVSMGGSNPSRRH